LRIVQRAADFLGFIGQCAGNPLYLHIGLNEIFRLGLVPPPDTVQRHLHQSEIACPLRDVALNRLDQSVNGRFILEATQGKRLPGRLGESLVAHASQPEHGVLPIGPKPGTQLLKRVIEIEIIGSEREQDTNAKRAVRQGAKKLNNYRLTPVGS
jgi:hypothetical protein